MSIWIALHEYTEGVTPKLVESRGQPTQTQMKKLFGEDFKPRSGDTIRVIGPWDVENLPMFGKKRRKNASSPLTHRKCGNGIPSVSVWQRSQIAHYVLDDEGEFCETNYPEDPEDVQHIHFCGECGRELSDSEIEEFESLIKQEGFDPFEEEEE